jgi:V8-like Glu-specific endopeptidase
MASKSKTTYLVNDELDNEQVSKPTQSRNSETVVDELMGSGEFAEAFETGDETSEAADMENHQSVSSPSVFRGPDAETESGEADEGIDSESAFESVPGWDESTLTESTEGDEALVEAYYADPESKAGGEEFFGFIAAAVMPMIKAVLPSLAGAVVQQGVKNPRLQQLLARLSKLGIKLPKRRETGDESSEEALEFDEVALTTLEQQLETLEVVIGKDDRVRIMTTKITPWKRICHLKIRTTTGKNYLGTGFFIGPRTIVTAGHCVYIHSQGGWVQQITVTPGRNDTETPFKSYTATAFRSVKGWVKDKARNYDYGVILLPKTVSVPPEIGAFGFASYSNQFLFNKRLNTAGYPGDKPSGTMWYHGRKAKSVTARTITYDIDTAGGQSGSAVWVRGSNGKRIVVGIHTNGAPSGNSATRITKPVFDNLKRWRTEGGNS